MTNRPEPLLTKIALFLNYSRFMLVFGAMAMTTAVSQIVVEAIHWQPILIVGLATYLVYTADNLLDWQKEKHHLQKIASWRPFYLLISLLLLPCVIGAIIYLTAEQERQFGVNLSILGGICLLIVYLSSKPQSIMVDQVLFYWLERLSVTLTWALATVLVPVWYAAHSPHDIRVYLAIPFIWMISWSIGVVWRFTNTIAGDQQNSVPKREQPLIQVMVIVNILALTQAVVDTVLQIFPIWHLSLALVPLANTLLLRRWHYAYHYPLIYCNTVIFTLIMLLLASTGVHILVGTM